MVRLSRLKSKYIPSYKEPSQEEQLNRLAEGEELFNAHLAESEERRRRFEELKMTQKCKKKKSLSRRCEGKKESKKLKNQNKDWQKKGKKLKQENRKNKHN